MILGKPYQDPRSFSGYNPCSQRKASSTNRTTYCVDLYSQNTTDFLPARVLLPQTLINRATYCCFCSLADIPQAWDIDQRVVTRWYTWDALGGPRPTGTRLHRPPPIFQSCFTFTFATRTRDLQPLTGVVLSHNLQGKMLLRICD